MSYLHRASLVRKGLFVTAGSLAGAALSTVIQMILSRRLMPEGMGQYELLQRTAMLVGALGTLGLGQASVYFLNRKQIPPSEVIANSLHWWAASSILLTIVLTVIMRANQKYFGSVPLATCITLAAAVAGSLMVNLLGPVLLASLRVVEQVSVNLTLPLVYLLSIAGFALSGMLTVPTAILAFGLGSVSAGCVTVWFLRESIHLRVRFDLRLFWRMTVYGAQLLVSNLMLIGSTAIGVLLLRHLMTEDFADVGYFGRAVALCGIVSLVVSSFTPLLYAKWTSVSSAGRVQQLQRALRLEYALGALFVIGVFLFGKWVLILLYGRAFLPSLPALHILIVMAVLKSATSIYSYLFAGDGRPLMNALVFSVPIPCMLVTMPLLVPRYGVAGAAWSLTIGAIAQLALAMVVSRRLYGVRIWSTFILELADIKYLRDALLGKRGPAAGAEEADASKAQNTPPAGSAGPSTEWPVEPDQMGKL